GLLRSCLLVDLGLATALALGIIGGLGGSGLRRRLGCRGSGLLLVLELGLRALRGCGLGGRLGCGLGGGALLRGHSISRIWVGFTAFGFANIARRGPPNGQLGAPSDSARARLTPARVCQS